MEEKDKFIQIDDPNNTDDPIDEEILELNDEVPDVPDDEEKTEPSNFTDTSQTENEDIIDLTETADTLSDNDIVYLTDTVDDYS